jgi:hypothetical protein
MSDVVAGAGFGVLATDVRSCLEPFVAKKLFHNKTKEQLSPLHF